MDKNIKKGLKLLWKYPSIWLLALIIFMGPIGNIFTYSIRLFFSIKTGNEFDPELFITNITDIGIMDIVFEISFIIIVFIFARYIDKFSYEDLGLKINFGGILNFVSGIIIAGIFISIPFVIYMLTGMVHITGFWELQQSGQTFGDFAVFQLIGLTLVAFQEELFHRAYLINNLKALKPAFVIIATSIVFSGVHLISIGFDELIREPLITIIGLVNIFIIGLIYAYYFFYNKDLWFVIGAHLSWNFLMGPVFGFPISGLPGKGLISIEESGSVLFTGGSFGPEGGIIVTISLIFMFLAVKTYMGISKSIIENYKIIHNMTK